MRFLFIGSGAIAARCLQVHAERFTARHQLVGILGPDELIGRAALASGAVSAPLGETRGEDALLSLIATQQPDIVVSVQYPWILSAAAIAAVDGRVANLHNAKLPDYRGHNTISHEILNRETVHTATLHWIAEEVDRGAEIATGELAIRPDDTAYSLWRRSIDVCADLFAQFLEEHERLAVRALARPVASGGRYYPKGGLAELKRIPDDADLETVDRIARAFWFPPHEPAHYLYDGRKVYVLPEAYEYKVNG